MGGCNVGVSLGYESDGDERPSVSLAAAPTEAAAGERIGLVAAASDDDDVREVLFFRVDAVGNVLLGRDAGAPYTFETTLPAAPGTTVRYFARAVDDAGQETDSAEVVVTVR
jgi:aqualysin 1